MGSRNQTGRSRLGPGRTQVDERAQRRPHQEEQGGRRHEPQDGPKVDGFAAQRRDSSRVAANSYRPRQRCAVRHEKASTGQAYWFPLNRPRGVRSLFGDLWSLCIRQKTSRFPGWQAALFCLLCACSTAPSGTPNGGPDGATPKADSGPGPDPKYDTGGPATDATGDDLAAPNDASSAGDTAAPDTGIPATAGIWPQAGGPDGTFRVNVEGAPTTWSVAANKNILWRTNLDNEGQGGIAVAGDLLFLTTFLPFSGAKTSLSIEGYAIDRTTGTIKWRTKPLVGNGGVLSWMADQYSDATSWTPITDGKYVWFFNSAGHMGCWDVAGKPDAAGILASIWEADFAGPGAPFPFNRQHEPFMIGNDLVILSPLGKGHGRSARKDRRVELPARHRQDDRQDDLGR